MATDVAFYQTLENRLFGEFLNEDTMLPGGGRKRPSSSSSIPSAAPVEVASEDASSGNNRDESSLPLFRSYMKRYPDGSLDVSSIFSRECFKEWLENRAQSRTNTKPEHVRMRAFRRVLVGHITASDGREPFTAEEECALLHSLRVLKPWKFITNMPVTHEKAFRAKGYHEKLSGGDSATVPPGGASKAKPSSRRTKRPRVVTQEETSGDDSFDCDYDDEADRYSTTPLESPAHSLEISGPPPPSSFPEQNMSTDLATVQNTLSTNLCNVRPEEFLKVSDSLDLSGSVALKAAQMATSSMLGYISNTFKSACISLLHYWIIVAALQFIRDFGSQWAAKLHETTRMGIISVGFMIPPNQADCKALAEELTRQYPGEGIVLIDHQAKNITQKYIAQNDVAIEYFGKLAREYGGTSVLRWHPTDTFHMLREMIRIYIYRGQVFVLHDRRIRCADGKFRRFTVHCHADVNYRVYVERSKMTDSTPLD